MLKFVPKTLPYFPIENRNADIEHTRKRFFEIVNSDKYEKYLSDLFCNKKETLVCKETKEFDVDHLILLNYLGCITTNSQPGICHEGDEEYDNRTQRAYVEIMMLKDEARELCDLINRTDIFAEWTCEKNKDNTVRVIVTYDWSANEDDSGSFSGSQPKWGNKIPNAYTAIPVGYFPSEEVPDIFENLNFKHIAFVYVIDMQPGRLACKYLYPKILIPIMKMIRKRYE
jgi:hypothetical protein